MPRRDHDLPGRILGTVPDHVGRGIAVFEEMIQQRFGIGQKFLRHGRNVFAGKHIGPPGDRVMRR